VFSAESRWKFHKPARAHDAAEARRKCRVKGRTMRETKSRLDANRKWTRHLEAIILQAFRENRRFLESRKARGKGEEDDSRGQ